jgi:hypothetical protein
MVELGGWFKEEFWTGAGTDRRINTKLITKQLESYLPADPAGVVLEGGLLRGWNVETRDSLARIPLYGENGKPLYGVNPDAIYADDDGYRALLEIEGGGAVQNNRLMKDVVETLLIPGAHHLALDVPHSIHGRSPYDFAINLISVIGMSARLQRSQRSPTRQSAQPGQRDRRGMRRGGRCYGRVSVGRLGERLGARPARRCGPSCPRGLLARVAASTSRSRLGLGHACAGTRPAMPPSWAAVWNTDQMPGRARASPGFPLL